MNRFPRADHGPRCNQIAKADLIVADLTGRNPNVFYETGYAHALTKRVILLTQRAEDIPFDLKDYPHVIYDGKIFRLKPELEKRIRWFLANPEAPGTSTQLNLELFIGKTKLGENPLITIWAQKLMYDTYGYSEYQFQVNLHNATDAIQTGPFLICGT